MPTPTQLRQRAASLRTTARDLDALPLAALRLAAGDDTWIGATALAFRNEVVTAERRVRAIVDAARVQARDLEREAVAAEARAAAIAVPR